MHPLIRFLLEHPVLLGVLVFWVIGAIGQAARRGASGRSASGRRAAAPPVRDAEEAAAELRRLLGMGREEPRAASPAASPAPTPEPARVPRRLVEPRGRERPRAAEPTETERPVRSSGERPPQPVLPSAGSRRLEIHVDPHLGESIGRRHLNPANRKGSRDSSFGSLGGRVQGPVQRSAAVSRFVLDDLKRAFVVSEILGPPRALRPLEGPQQG